MQFPLEVNVNNKSSEEFKIDIQKLKCPSAGRSSRKNLKTIKSNLFLAESGLDTNKSTMIGEEVTLQISNSVSHRPFNTPNKI